MSTDIHRPSPTWTFGDRTRKVRREMRLSQAAFAALIGRGEKAVAAWEVGGKPEDVVAVAEAIEAATGYAAGWLLGVDRPSHPDPEPSKGDLSPHTRGKWAEMVRLAPRQGSPLPRLAAVA